jgi:hypothetical protein
MPVGSLKAGIVPASANRRPNPRFVRPLSGICIDTMSSSFACSPGSCCTSACLPYVVVEFDAVASFQLIHLGEFFSK